MYDVIVIGGGPAGTTAALRARELGASVALVERGRLGGTCTNDGCVPTRVLAKAARLARDAEDFEKYGIETGGPVRVNFAQMIRRTQQVVYTMHEKKQLGDHLRQAGVDTYIEVGAASFVDANTLQIEDGTRLEAKKFIICAGGHARKLPFPGSEYTITHHDVWSLDRLPDSIVIVGAAATGCQVASIMAQCGTHVTLMEVAPRILPIEDTLTSETVRRAFERRGIQVITGIGGLDRVEKTASGLDVFYKAGEEIHPISAGACLMAVGWKANTEPLNLSAAGVELDQRGFIQVDDMFRTSAPNIYAAGDITGRMMLVQSGTYEGRTAAENAVLGDGQKYKHMIVPAGGFTDPEYASVGLTEEKARASGDVIVAVVPYTDVDRAVIDDHPEGFCKLIADKETHRIVGAHIVGEQALETVQLVAAGMAAGMWIEQLAELEIAYPTYAAVVGLAARKIVRELGVTPIAAQWRALSRLDGGAAPVAEWERSTD